MISIIGFLAVYHSISCSFALQCLDENNEAVDWLIAYKLPAIKHEDKMVEAGTAYIYMTSNDHPNWKRSNISIDSPDCFLGNTLAVLYERKEDLMYLLYNDEPPEIPKSRKGHTKGVVMINNYGGFWLIHSVPKFPVQEPSYMYPETGRTYGQSFLCISMDLENLNQVGIQLQYNEPEIYGRHITTNISALVPEIVNAANNVVVTKSPWYRISNIYSKAQVPFFSFAKSRNFNKELYEDLVAPSLQSNLLVETWPNGSGRLRSNCSQQFKVNNIDEVSLEAANISFKSTHDHSKWAVSSTSDEKAWICIGDINRAEHQEVRGGGTMCLNNKQIAKQYQKSVESVESCNKL